eukprot:1402699-Lingulodinium_polyedra.AAC.1
MLRGYCSGDDQMRIGVASVLLGCCFGNTLELLGCSLGADFVLIRCCLGACLGAAYMLLAC